MTNCEVSLSEPHDAAVLTDMVKIHYLYSSSFEEVPATCNHLPNFPSHWDKQTINISLHFREPNVTIFSSAAPITTQVSDASPWLRRLVAGLTFRRPGFNARLSHFWICGVQSGTGTGSPAITAALSCQCHSTSALYSFIHLLSTLYKLSNWLLHHVRYLN